ncbi:hypothetical protein Tco_0272861 [Tanacetum coccineum]
MKFGVSSWHGSRVDGRSYLLSGGIDGSEANRIISYFKLEFENSRFTSDADLRRLVSFDVFRKARGVKQLHELQDDHRVTKGREDVREVLQQRRSGAKKKLSKCGRNQMGNEPILALPEGADDFVVYYDARSKDLEAGLEKGEEALSERDSRWMKLFSEYGFEAKYHLGKANVDVVPWSRKKE